MLPFLLPILAVAGPDLASDLAAPCDPPPTPPTECDRPDVFCVGSGSDPYDTLGDLPDVPAGATVVVTGPGGALTVTDGGDPGVPVTYYGGKSSSEWTITVLADHVVIQGFQLVSPSIPQPCVSVGGVLRYTEDVEVVGNACSGVAGVLLTTTIGASVRSNVFTMTVSALPSAITTLFDADTAVTCNRLTGSGSAVWMTGAVDPSIERNVISGTSLAGIELDACDRPVVAGNVITDSDEEGILAGYLGASSGVVVMGNTIRVTSAAALRIDGTAGGHAWFDNVLASNDKAGAVHLDTTEGAQSGANVIVGSLVVGQEAGTVGDWRAMGLEQGSVEAGLNDIFVAEDDLRLADGSPAVGLGLLELDGTEMILVDMHGTKRPCGALDAGAFESCEADDPGTSTDGPGVEDDDDDDDMAFGLGGGYCGHAPAPTTTALALLAALMARRSAPTGARRRSSSPRGPRTPAPSR